MIMLTRTTTSILAISIASLGLIGSGCDRTDTGGSNTPVAASATIPAAYFTTNRPEEVSDLLAIKEGSKIGEEVTFLARVGGRVEPFVDGVAIFMVADPALESCELMGEEDHCPVPWDYCCEPRESLTAGSATIRIMGDDGRPLPASAQGAGGLAPARFLVVKGVVADRNDQGLFVVDAERIWVGGRPDRDDLRLGSRADEVMANVPAHDHDFDGLPDHDHGDHDHGDHDHSGHDHSHDHSAEAAGVAPEGADG
jgi:hypothetical protein